MKQNNLNINNDLPEGATKLSPEDLKGLKPDYISTRAQLNEFEKQNIMDALVLLKRKNYSYSEILTVGFCVKLHSMMFNKTWDWKGTFRTYEVNIGNTPPEQITMRIKNALDNTIYWIENKTYPVDEICIRLHHAIVWIHPFPNGNGRHSRIICDELRRSLGYASFTWGNSRGNQEWVNQMRSNYINALRSADRKDFAPLLLFATL
jgi:Fic-DOC domain mobile mystery protein B